MFCPKCGTAVKEGSGFCPKCGAKLQEGKPTNSSGMRVRQKTDHAYSSQGGRQKLFLASGAIAVFVLLAIIFFTLFWIGYSGDSGVNGQELMDAYFEEHTGYGTSNQEQYQDCFRYAVNDMTLQLSGKMAFLLDSVGVSTDGVDLERVSSQVGDKISGYFSRSDNQIVLVDEVLAHSSCKVGKIQKDGDRATAEVTVTSLDISDVNRLLIDDTVSVQKFAALAVQFILGNKKDFIGNLVDVASGDLSFVLDGFVEKAGEAKGRKTYAGQAEFIYDRESGEWSIDRMDEGLLEAYYGIME